MAEPDSRSNFWSKYVRAALSLVMQNPVLTPKILFVFALAPFIVVIVVWALILLKQ